MLTHWAWPTPVADMMLRVEGHVKAFGAGAGVGAGAGAGKGGEALGAQLRTTLLVRSTDRNAGAKRSNLRTSTLSFWGLFGGGEL